MRSTFTVRRIVRAAAIIVGLVAGIVLAPLILAAMFTLRNEDLPEGMIALAAPLLLEGGAYDGQGVRHE